MDWRRVREEREREREGNVHVDPAFPFEDGKEPVSLYFPNFGLKTQTRTLDWNSKAPLMISRRRRCSSPSSPIPTFLFHWSLLWSSPPFFHRRTSLALSTLSMPSMQTAPAMLMMEVRATSASAMSDGTWPFLQPVLILNLSHLFNSIGMNNLPKPNHELKTAFCISFRL